MSVPPLTQLAIRKVPLEQVFDKGLLSGPFAPVELSEIQKRVTLENLYRENLFNADLDIAIFWMALEKIAPTLVWSYLNEELSLEDIPSYSPLSSRGLSTLANLAGYSKRESQEATREALDKILIDLFNILDHPGEYFSIRQEAGFAWDYRNGYRIFLIPSGPITHEQSEATGEPQTPIIIHVTTLDDLVTNLVSSLANHFNYTGRLNFIPIDPDQLEIQQKVGLGALRAGYGGNLKAIYNRLWNQDGSILTNGNLDLSLSRLGGEVAIIKSIGAYLYIFFGYSQPLYFKHDDGDLIVASLAYNPKKWQFVTHT